MATDLPAFQYHDLRPDQFRLIHVDPDRQSQDSLLNLQMREFQRGPTPQYVALSYTWGTAPATHLVSLNGQPFYVRPNLYEFLQYIAEADESRKEWTFLWIDAICINQVNNEEKAQQVRCMHLIYRNASLVMSWLGTPPGLEAIANKQKFRKRIFHQPDKEIKKHMPHNEYFSRLWILQELWSADKHMFICARRRFSMFDNLYAIVSASRVLPQHDPLYERFGMALTMCGSKPWGHKEPWTIFHDTRESLCTDARDRVFALLHLFRPDYGQMLEPFFPDYDLSMHRVNLITLASLRQQYGDEGVEDKYFRWGWEKYCTWLHIAEEHVEEMQAVSVVKERSELYKNKIGTPKWQADDVKLIMPQPQEEETSIEARREELRTVASRALSFETEAEAKVILDKEWYVNQS